MLNISIIRGYKMRKLSIISTLMLLFVVTSSFAANISLHHFFNKNNCDQILKNQGYFKTCYSYKNKGAKYVAYTLYGNKVNTKNIKKRPRFYEDTNIPKRYRSVYSDYTHNQFHEDRGHLYPDAAADWNYKSLHAAYTMSNIIPQYFLINRSKKMWAGVERYARYMATSLDYVNVLNGVVYSKHPKRIGRNRIAVPSAFWKMIYNKSKGFQKCFYFENKKQKADSIRDFIVDCKKITKG